MFTFSDMCMCAEYNVAVFVTNQMTADPGATLTYLSFMYPTS